MKKLLCILLAMLMVLSLAACGGTPDEPGRDVYKDDIQEYITDVLDDSAEITSFKKQSSDVDGEELTVICVVEFSGANGTSKGEFTLTYELDGKDWELEKCRVELDEEGQTTTEPTRKEETKETEPTPTIGTVVAGPSAVSDNWKDFTFTLEGKVYGLPTHYQNFVNNGWKIDGTRSDIGEDDKIPGYTRVYLYLSNGNTYFSAELTNMSGHARVAKDCDITEITIEANDELDLQLTGGIHCLSTVDEVQAAYGAPSSINSYTDYASLKYEVDSYIYMSFLIYGETTKYNEITLCNVVAQERDATTPKDERPSYLDDYVAPTELGSDVTSTVFQLDGVLYQLPCPVEEFLNNGWTVKRDSIGSLGAGNDEYGLTLTKDDCDINLTMINYSEYETYTKYCAVSGISISGYEFKDAPKDIVQLPGGVTNWTPLADAEAVYTGFSRYDGTYTTSLTYNSDDYTVEVRYAYWNEDGYADIEMENENWEY